MDDDESPSGRGREQEGKGRLLSWLDVVAKLMGAFAVVYVACLAASLQSRRTGI